MPFRVTAVQAKPVFLDREAPIAKSCAPIERAGVEGARLIAFPEVWVAGYPVWVDAAPGAALAKRAFARLGAAAREAGAYVVIGVHELVGNTIYAALLHFGPDGVILGVHRKLMPTYQERMLCGRGEGGRARPDRPRHPMGHNMKIVQERTGHRPAAFTLDRYGHAMNAAA